MQRLLSMPSLRLPRTVCRVPIHARPACLARRRWHHVGGARIGPSARRSASCGLHSLSRPPPTRLLRNPCLNRLPDECLHFLTSVPQNVGNMISVVFRGEHRRGLLRSPTGRPRLPNLLGQSHGPTTTEHIAGVLILRYLITSSLPSRLPSTMQASLPDCIRVSIPLFVDDPTARCVSQAVAC